MHLRSFIKVISIGTLLFVSNFSWAYYSTQEIVLHSWIGQSQSELFSVFGKPNNLQIIPNSPTYWVSYVYQSTTYIPKTYTTNSSSTLNTNSWLSPLGNISTYGNNNTSTTIQEHGGYNVNYNCSIDFTLDSKTLQITNLKWQGDMYRSCNFTLLAPSNISPTALQNFKNNMIEVEAFIIRDSKHGKVIQELKEDSIAYKNGLRNNDIILATEMQGNTTKYKINRKKNIFSKTLITKEISFTPTHHSWAYLNFSPRQREIWNVTK
jgi:hypothetical protein